MRFTQIQLRHMRRSEALSARIRELADRLEEAHPRISNIRVTVESTGHHKHNGNTFLVSLAVHLPGRQVVANRHEHEDVYVALRDAFDAVNNQFSPQSHRLAA